MKFSNVQSDVVKILKYVDNKKVYKKVSTTNNLFKNFTFAQNSGIDS